jgi:uncharacterized membrane protein YhaH (DUF805 family)
MTGVVAWDEWFSWTIRRNRQSFFFATVLLACVIVAAVLVIRFFSPTRNGLAIFQLAFAMPAAIASYFLTAQRLRDMNVTGWLALLWIPAGLADLFLYGAASLAFWLILLAVPGTKGPNRYGPDPLGDSAAPSTKS